MRILETILLLLVLSLTAAPSTAQPQSDANRAAARALGREAVSAYEQGDYFAALDNFQRAHDLVGLTTTGLWVARSLAKLNRLVEASEQYLAVTRMTLPAGALELHAKALEEAAQERAVLLPRIAQLTVRVRGVQPGDEVTVRVDEGLLPSALVGAKRPTDPGEHRVEARARGVSKATTITLAEGEHGEVVLDLQSATVTAPVVAGGSGAPTATPDATPKPQPQTDASEADTTSPGTTQRLLGWVALGVGAAGVAVGAVTGGMAVGARSSLQDNCPDLECEPEFHGDVDSYETLRVVSSVSFIAGGTLAAAGVVLLLTAPSADEAPSSAMLVPYASPTGVGLMGWF